MLYHQRHHFQSGICMSGTEDANGFYGDIIPASYIYTSYEPAVVKALVKRQKQVRKAGGVNENVFLILEDLAYDKSPLARDKWLSFIFMNGRHFNITLFLSSQFALALPPSYRSQVDYVYAYKLANLRERYKLWENFFGCFKDYWVFEEVVVETNNDFKCLVLDATGQDTDVESQLRYWQAERDLPAFKLGNKAYWAWHLMHYDPTIDSDSSDDERPKNRPKVAVRHLPAS